MRILVVGGSGYLGTLVVPLLAQRHNLRVFDLQPPESGEVEYVQGSVCDPSALAGAAAGMDAVLYMAMGSAVPLDGDHWARIESRVNAFDVNVKGLHLALHAAHLAGISQVVFTSSMSVYADNGIERTGSGEGENGEGENGEGENGEGENDEGENGEDTPPDSDQIYGFTKRLGEEVCRNACRTWGMSVNALRLFLPVPEDKWLVEARQAAPTPWTTAEDTARALLAALEYSAGFQAFTISGDYEQKLMSLTKAKRLLNWEPLARPVK